ncbi:MAG: zinc-binding dehydrogenase [Candidatus Lokiarchaeota archaeon]|nr:zinc-binding dehydrogenase [Candidatus Lokiarchaeota archaeon]
MKSGICGTDISIVKGHLPTPLPIVPGHEFSGIVYGLGDKVDKDLFFKRVTCEINTNICGICYFCENGIPTNCIQRQALGIDVDGAFVQYIVVDDYLIHEIPDSLSFEHAALLEPLAAAVNTYELMPFTPSDNIVVIYGAGKMGQLIAQVTKQYSSLFKHKVGDPPMVVVVSRTDEKLAIAKKNGADLIINSKKEDPVAKIMEITNNIGADIVVECTGNPKIMDQVVKSTRTRGKIALKSTHGLPTPINITDIVVREIALYGTRCGPFEKAKLFLASDLINLDDLITKRVGLSNINQGLEDAEDSTNIKVIIDNQK